IAGGRRLCVSLGESLPELLLGSEVAVSDGIAVALSVKLRYVKLDEFDKGPRNLLNYGHCFGHALEAASGFRIPHGQAVVAGMILANLVAERRGDLGSKTARWLEEHILLP